MELVDVAAVVHHFARNNEFVLVVHDSLHIVARNTLTALDQKPGVRIGQGQLRLTARLQPIEVDLRARAPGHQRRYFGADIGAISAAAIIVAVVPRLLGLRRIIVLKRLAVSLDLPVQLYDLFGEPLAREDARLAGIAMEERAVDCDNGSADKPKLACQQHEAAVRRFQRLPVLLAEVGDRPITRPQILQQPDQFQIAARFPLQPPRRPDLVDVAVKIELQQVGGIIGRLPHGFSASVGMTEAQLCKVEDTNEALDRPDRIVRPNIILDPCRKQTGLIPALAGLECMIRHEQNRTSTLENAEFLPSLVGLGKARLVRHCEAR